MGSTALGPASLSGGHPNGQRAQRSSPRLRTRDWKYIRYLDHPDYEELYDLASDPREEWNLARDEQHAPKLAELRERCSLAAESVGD